MMRLTFLLLLLLPVPALAADRNEQAAAGGAAAVAAGAAVAARRKAKAKRRAKTLGTEAERFGWDEKRQALELRNMKRREHGHIRVSMRRRRRR